MGKATSKSKNALEEGRVDDFAKEVRGNSKVAGSTVIRLTDGQVPRKGLGALSLNIKDADSSQKLVDGLKSVWNIEVGEDEQDEDHITYKEPLRSVSEREITVETEEFISEMCSSGYAGTAILQQNQRGPFHETLRSDDETGMIASENACFEAGVFASAGQAVDHGKTLHQKEATTRENRESGEQSESKDLSDADDEEHENSITKNKETALETAELEISDSGHDLKGTNYDNLESESRTVPDDTITTSPTESDETDLNVDHCDEANSLGQRKDECNDEHTAEECRSSVYVTSMTASDSVNENEGNHKITSNQSKFDSMDQPVGNNLDMKTTDEGTTPDAEPSGCVNLVDVVKAVDDSSLTLSDISEVDIEEDPSNDKLVYSNSKLHCETTNQLEGPADKVRESEQEGAGDNSDNTNGLPSGSAIVLENADELAMVSETNPENTEDMGAVNVKTLQNMEDLDAISAINSQEVDHLPADGVALPQNVEDTATASTINPQDAEHLAAVCTPKLQNWENQAFIGATNSQNSEHLATVSKTDAKCQEKIVKESILVNHFKEFLGMFKRSNSQKSSGSHNPSIDLSEQENVLLPDCESESDNKNLKSEENAVVSMVGFYAQGGELQDQIAMGDIQALGALSNKVKLFHQFQDNCASEVGPHSITSHSSDALENRVLQMTVAKDPLKEGAESFNDVSKNGIESVESKVVSDNRIVGEGSKEDGPDGIVTFVCSASGKLTDLDTGSSKADGAVELIEDNSTMSPEEMKQVNSDGKTGDSIDDQENNASHPSDHAAHSSHTLETEAEGVVSDQEHPGVVPAANMACSGLTSGSVGEGFEGITECSTAKLENNNDYASGLTNQCDEPLQDEEHPKIISADNMICSGLALESAMEELKRSAEFISEQMENNNDYASGLPDSFSAPLGPDTNKESSDREPQNIVSSPDRACAGVVIASEKAPSDPSYDQGFTVQASGMKRMPSVDHTVETVKEYVKAKLKLSRWGKFLSVNEVDGTCTPRNDHSEQRIDTLEVKSKDTSSHQSLNVEQLPKLSDDDVGHFIEASTGSDIKISDGSSVEGLSDDSLDSGAMSTGHAGDVNSKSGALKKEETNEAINLTHDVSCISEMAYPDSLDGESYAEDSHLSCDVSLDSEAILGDIESSGSLSREVSLDSETGPLSHLGESLDSVTELSSNVELSDDLGIIYEYEDTVEWHDPGLEMRQDDRGIMLSDDESDADDEVFSNENTTNEPEQGVGKLSMIEALKGTTKQLTSRDGSSSKSIKVKFRSKNVTVGWKAMKLLSAECVPDGEGLEGKLQESAVKMSKLLQDAEQAHHAVSPDVEGAQAKVTLQAYGLKIGDKVMVGGVKTGVLRFCGPTEFASGIWAGIELDEAAGKNDGSVGGVPYFRCSPKHGIFAPVTKISKPGILVTRGSSTPRKAVNYGHVDTSKVTAKVDTGLHRTPSGRSTAGRPGEEALLEPGERVLVAGQRRGVVRFSGETDFAPGWWYGIELDRPVGKNDGSVNGKRYFTCKPKYGVFAPPSRIQKLSDLPDAGECLEAVAERQRRLSGGAGTNSQPALSATSSAKSKPGPTSRHQSRLLEAFNTHSNIPTPTKRQPPKSSGSASGLRRPLSLTNSGGEFRLQEGTSVFCNNELGVIRFMGPVEFAEGVWLGVELRTNKGKNDGAVGGTRYFTCRPQHGLLVRPSKVTVRGINGAKLMGNLEGTGGEGDKKDASY